MKLLMRSVILIIIISLLFTGCAVYTTVELKNFVEGLETNLSKIEMLTLHQLISQDEFSTKRVEKYVVKRQCEQDSNDPLIILGCGEPVDLKVEANVDNQAGIVLIAPQRKIGSVAKTGSSASWKLLPVPLSSVPQRVFENRTNVLIHLPDEMKKVILAEVIEEKQELIRIIGKLIEAYPSNVNCKPFLKGSD